MLHSSDDRGIARTSGFQSQRVLKGYACGDETISSLADSNFSQFAVVCGAGGWDISAAKHVKLARRGGIRIHECGEQQMCRVRDIAS